MTHFKLYRLPCRVAVYALLTAYAASLVWLMLVPEVGA